MELIKFLGVLATFLPVVYGAPSQTSSTLHPEILAAMKRDLGLDANQANARVAREISASEIIEQLQASAGDAFAGAWVADDGNTVNVAVTDESLSEEISAAGATPVVLSNSIGKLEKAMEALNEKEISIPEGRGATEDKGIASWFIDIESNKLVIEALQGSLDLAEELAKDVGLSEGEFEIQTVDEIPTAFATIQGGDPYYIGGGRCSIGFSTTTGFVTAGHCGRTGTTVTSASGERLGAFAGSIFPGSDMAHVRTTGGHSLTPYINGYGSGRLPVSGSRVAPTGSSICRSGSTTGVYCGSVSAFGATVNYAEGRVTGLTRTTVCAEPGDSGGSFYSGSQAQGVTSGGSGNCRFGGTTFFQPVNPILSRYGLTLVTV